MRRNRIAEENKTLATTTIFILAGWALFIFWLFRSFIAFWIGQILMAFIIWLS